MKQARAVRWLLLAAIAGGILGWLATGLAIYARITYISFFLFLVTYFWAILSIRGMRVARNARSLRASVGEVFEEQFVLSNKSHWPCLWVEVDNQSTLPQAAGARLLTAIGGRQKRSYIARTWLTHRGAFPLGPTTLLSGDPFGLFVTQRKSPARETLVVLPMTVDIPVFHTPPGLLPGGKAVRQKTTEVTPHAVGVREYVPGDPMKRIHWPSTARRNRFMVKEFEQDPQAEVWLFLDAQKSTHLMKEPGEDDRLGQGWWLQKRTRFRLPDDTFEYAVSVTGSLARYFLAERRSVGLASAGIRFTILPAERGDRQTGKILETLAFLQPDGQLPLHGLVSTQSKLLPIGSSVMLVTSSTRPDVILAAEDAQGRNLRPMVILLRAETFGGQESSEPLLAGLAARNIPVCPIECGMDIGKQLESFAVMYQQLTFPKMMPYRVAQASTGA